MEADRVVRDDQAKRVSAEGSVEIRYDGRTLRADRLVYDQGAAEGQGVIRAFGHVQIINEDGSIEYADQMTLDEKMRAGVALGFSARMAHATKIAAATAVKRSDQVQELNRAIYTPCEICAGEKPKSPTWSLSADRVIRDKAKRIIYYRNMRVHILNVPVFYLPVFWHADPTSERASGLLAPSFGASQRRGFSYEQPYFWVLSPSSDLTVTPQISSKVNPLLSGRYRKRFYSGSMDLRFGYTNDREVDGDGHKFGEATNRSYILGRGSFRVNENWLWGFTAERASDPLIFDKYDIGKAFEARGPYVADDRRLISQAYAIRQDKRSYFSIATFSIQGLRPGDNDRTFPLVAPLIEGRYESGLAPLGGRLRLNASAVSLSREQSPANLTTFYPGLDSRRVTVGADWRRDFTSEAGLRVSPFVNLRADAYSLSDVLTGIGTGTRSKSVTRTLTTAGADISYPFYRRGKSSTVVIEPLAQIAVSPSAKQVVVGMDSAGQPIYLNEDSVAFEFDETTLFRSNKFPGYDLYEDGLRMNVAGRASVMWDDGRRASLLVGRSFRDQMNDVFPARSGLRSKASDWIVAGDAQPFRGLSFFTRARMDSKSLDVHRLEAGANVSNARFGTGFVRYLTDDFDINGVRRENLDVGGEIYITKHWGVSTYANRDLKTDAWVIRDVGVFYRDNCVRVDVVFRREDTVLGRLGPNSTVNVRLTLATLGGP